MRKLVAKFSKIKTIFALVGFLLFTITLALTFVNQANATSVYFGFSSPNVGHASLSQGPNFAKEKDLLMHAGTNNVYPDINFSTWVDTWSSIGMNLRIKEYTDGQLTKELQPAAVYKSGATQQVDFKYLAVRVYPYQEKVICCVGSNNDATGSGVIYPKDDAINSLRNQEIRYEFLFWENKTPHVSSGATLVISRKHIEMTWSHGLNQAGTQAELNSGTYRSGGTTYPEVRGYALSTQYNQANIEFRSTEQLNTQPVKYAEWVQRGSADVWDMGKNNYRFGTWHIYWNGVSGNNACNTSNGIDYIRCYTVRFIPNKAEIDNLKGNVHITIELAHIEGNVEYMKRTLNFTIRGREHHRPVASLYIPENYKNGVNEAQYSGANFVIYTSYGRIGRMKVYYSIAQTGNFLTTYTTIPQLKFVWFENRQQHVAFRVYIQDDEIDEADATITVALVADANYPYTIDANPAYQSITFAVRDNDVPTVSIAPIPDTDPPPQVQEGPNVFARFKVTASIAPYQDLQVAYTITQGGTNKIDSTYQLPTHITITAGTTETTFMVKTAYDTSANNNEGRIRIRLDANTSQANAYNVATADEDKIATVLLVNNDVPVVSIAVNANSTPHVLEADNAKVDFDITTNVAVTTAFDVKINLTKTGDFIDVADEQTVSIAANTTSGSLSVPIVNDENSEVHGTLTATLAADTNTPKKYTVTNVEANSSATASIIDDDDTPIISISAHSDSSPFVAEEPNGEVKFLFEASILPETALTINITVTELSTVQDGNSDFIAQSSEDITTHTFPANKLLDTLSIPIVFDEDAGVTEDDGKVTVTLRTDSNSPATYFIPSEVADQSAEVMIKANTVPIISIALNPATHFQVTEADNLVLMFDVSSNIPIAENNLVVNIGVQESHDMLVPVSMRATTATINIGTQSTTYELSVINDNVDEWNSAVTVSVEADTNTPKKYVLSSTVANRSAAVSVNDEDTPVMSIRVHEDSKPSITEQPGVMAKFEVTSDILTDPGTTVNILVENVGENFIDSTNPLPTSVDILAPNLTAVIAIPLTYDQAIETENGKVKITIQPDPNRNQNDRTQGAFYNLAQSTDDRVAEVDVLANSSPEVSIAVHMDSMNGTSEGSKVKFTITAAPLTGQTQDSNLVIGVLITEEDTSNFLPAVDTRPTSVAITASATTGVLEVTLDDDNIHEVGGSIKATLQADTANPPTYVLAPDVTEQSATASVTDNDTPIISIAVHEDSQPSVLEAPGGIVKFLITSSTAPYEDITIEFEVTNTLESYLSTTSTIPENIILAMGQTSVVVEVPIKYRIAENEEGKITATLEDHASDSSKYTIAESPNQAATATIDDNSLPIISVIVDTESASGVTEADDAVVKFKIFANIAIESGKTVDVGYSISESHAYLSTSVTTTGTVSLMGDEPTEIIAVAIENDSIDEANGTVTLTLNEDTNAEPTYTIGNSLADRTSDANVTDDDIPTISIATHPDSLPSVTENPGAVAKFVVSSDLAPYKDIIIGYSVADTGDYLPASRLIPISANLAAGSTTGELIIPIKYDTNADSDGSITVRIDRVMNPVDYQQSQTNNTAMVMVKNLDLPVLSIAVHQDSLPQAIESESSPILFEITTTSQFSVKTVFNYDLSETADFLDSAERLKSVDTFPAGASSYVLPIRFNDDQVQELNGAVTVTLAEDTGDQPLYAVNANPEERTATADVNDDELPYVMIRSVSAAVIEGSPVGFELYTDSIREETFTVNLEISGQTNFLQDSPSRDEFTREYDTGMASKFVFEFDTIDNNLPGGRGTVTVTILPGDNYLINSLNKNTTFASVAIVDNDTEIDPIISIRAEEPLMTAGEKVVFTISAVPAPEERVMLDVTVTPENDGIILWRIPRRVEVIDGKGYLKFYTTKSSAGGMISATVVIDDRFEFLSATSEVEIHAPSQAPVDQDAPSISVASLVVNSLLNMNTEPNSENSQQGELYHQQLPEVSIFTITQSVEEGQTIQFQISSSTQLNSTLSIEVAISSTGNAVPEQQNATILLTSNNSNAILEVPTYDDNIAEESETVTAEVIESASYSISEPKFAVATVLDTDDQQQRRNQIETANQQVVPAFMNAIGRSTYTATNNHLDLALTNKLQTSFNLGGENTLRGLVTTGGNAINEDSLSLSSVLGESSFVLSLSPEQSGYNIGSIWGLGDQVNIFKENLNESHSLDGDVFIGHFGADARLSQDSLVGLQMSISESELTYQALNQDDLNYSVTTNLMSSYYGWSSADYGLEVRVMGGYGYGDFIINQAEYTPLLLHSDFITTSLNGVANLATFGSLQQGLKSLDLKADSSFIQFIMQDDTNFLSDFEYYSNLNRVVTEYSYQQTFEQGVSLSSFAQFGGIWGQQDSNDRHGFEVSSGIEVRNLHGFAISGNGQYQLDQSENFFENGGVIGEILFDRNYDQLGLQANISPSYGSISNQKISGIEIWNIFDRSLTQNDSATNIVSEIAWGLNIEDSAVKLTPYFRLKLEELALNSQSLGTKIRVGPNSHFVVEGKQDARYNSISDYGMSISGKISW